MQDFFDAQFCLESKNRHDTMGNLATLIPSLFCLESKNRHDTMTERTSR